MKNVKSVLAGLCLGVAAFGLTSAPARAVLMDNGLTTIDTATNLEWLDLTESIARTYNDVAGHFGSGGDFEGWRHATLSEVTGLFANAGYTEPHISAATSAMLDFINLFGPTISAPGPLGGELHEALGFFDDQNATSEIGLAFAHYDTRVFDNITFDSDIARIIPDSISPDQPLAGRGNWLVRSVAVPEPGTLALFGLGLAGLCFARRRKAA